MKLKRVRELPANAGDCGNTLGLVYARGRAGVGLAGGERAAVGEPAEIEFRGEEGERGDSFPATFSANSSIRISRKVNRVSL